MLKRLGGAKMNHIIVYHGGTQIIEHPLCNIGRKNLDFGQGFYVTDIKSQAEEWAIRMSLRRNEKPLINRYLLNKEAFILKSKTLIFEKYDRHWLEFIVNSRKELNPAKDYDYIEGGVANDRVIDTVNLYMLGLMDLDTALKRLSEHRPNNQICLLNQELTDKYLIYDGTEKL